VHSVFFRYTKPVKRPEPPTITDFSFLKVDSGIKDDAVKRDYLWLISRLRCENGTEQEYPSWTGFNSIVSNADLTLATVRYLPFLNATPSDLNTLGVWLTSTQ